MDNENGIDNRNRNCNWIILGFNAIDTFNYKEFSIEYIDRKSTLLNSSHIPLSRMPSSA